MHQSIATIYSPEFINLQTDELNPLMSKCEVKVMYIGENRNHSFISKEQASEMAKTLRGSPIVGYYDKEYGDFSDHGERITIERGGVKKECLTFPYGYIAPDSKVWFQKFEDTDEFGNSVIHEYLMATGYLWTGQFPECQSVIEHGKGQSMELDEKTLQGKWSINNKTGVEFFIINDATFTKLCILGDEVEPCFEGASVTAPEVSVSFTLNKEFKQTLFSMMEDLKKSVDGGKLMENEVDNVKNSTLAEEEAILKKAAGTEENNQPNTEAPAEDATFAKKDEEKEEEKKTEENAAPEADDEDEKKKKEFACADDEDEKKKKDFVKEEDEDKKKEEEKPASEDKDAPAAEKEDDEDEKKKYSLLEEQYNTLKSEYESLKASHDELLSFKLRAEEKEKDAMIASFYMLSDEDKAEVIANKTKYSVEDIESKLSVICVRKKVNFNLEEETSENAGSVVTTFALEENDASVPAWIKACENTQKNRK